MRLTTLYNLLAKLGPSCLWRVGISVSVPSGSFMGTTARVKCCRAWWYTILEWCWWTALGQASWLDEMVMLPVMPQEVLVSSANAQCHNRPTFAVVSGASSVVHGQVGCCGQWLASLTLAWCLVSWKWMDIEWTTLGLYPPQGMSHQYPWKGVGLEYPLLCLPSAGGPGRLEFNTLQVAVNGFPPVVCMRALESLLHPQGEGLPSDDFLSNGWPAVVAWH